MMSAMRRSAYKQHNTLTVTSHPLLYLLLAPQAPTPSTKKMITQETEERKSVDTDTTAPVLQYAKLQKEKGNVLRSVTIVEEEAATERELRLRRQVSIGRPQYPDRASQVVGEFRCVVCALISLMSGPSLFM